MHSRSVWQVANKGLLAIIGAFIFATIASVFFLSSTLLKLDASIAGAGQSSLTIGLLQSLMSSLDDAESGARGYVISGNARELGPYHSALKKIPGTFEDIDAAPSSLITREDVRYLRQNSDERLELLKQLVEAKTIGDNDRAVEIVSSGQGKEAMDNLRERIAALSDKGIASTTQRQVSSHDSVRRAVSVAVAVSVFVIGICVLLLWYFRRTLQSERALENTKSEFLSLASHQMRTPATNVKQYLGLMLDGYLGKLTKKQRNALEIAYKNNESEIKIMNDLLDVAKLDLKRIQLRKQSTNVVVVVKQVIKDYKQHAANKGQKIVLKAPSELRANVDRAYLKGVIEKLIDNAIKYSKNKTTISVSISVDDTLRTFEIVVRDQGLGIHKREISKLFMKFSRIANEFSANSEGSGLGLYWVKQVMSLHGGSVEVRTQEGRGSQFIVRAPLD